MGKVISGIPLAIACTPSDTVEVSYCGLYIGTTGNVKVKTAAGDVVTFMTVPVGFLVTGQIQLVYNTDTTASNIVAYKNSW